MLKNQEIFSAVRRIEIKTKGLSRNIFAGQYHSAFKGRGMTFSEVREYQFGDDIRNIDWNVTARFNHPYVKVFEEEREMTVMLIIDVSRSLSFGTDTRTKQELATEIAAVLSFSVIHNNDKVGAIFFSDHIEKYIPPKKGKKHILNLIHSMLNFTPQSNKTKLPNAIEYLTRVVKRRCIAFIISDFMDKDDFTHELRIASKKHDVIAIQVYDKMEKELPNIGLLKVEDAENGIELIVDTSNTKLREQHKKYWLEQEQQLKDSFYKSRVDWIQISTNEDYVKPLRMLFEKRI